MKDERKDVLLGPKLTELVPFKWRIQFSNGYDPWIKLRTDLFHMNVTDFYRN